MRRPQRTPSDRRLDLLALLGGQCVIPGCETDDPEMLHIEHTYDDRAEDRKRLGGNPSLYGYYLKHPDEAKKNLQVMCANHNWKKRYANGSGKLSGHGTTLGAC